jgi:CRP/FNR family transcriptional regulator
MSTAKIEKSRSANGAAHQLDADAMGETSWDAGEQPTLWKKGRQKRFMPKEIIYRESGRVDRVCLIRSGLVKLLSYLPNGRARIVRLHAKGHWIGLEGLMGETYEHTAIAVDDVEVQYASIHSLQRLVRDNPRQLGHLLYQWHGDLAQADRWISDFSTGGIQPRVARLLEFLAELEYGEAADRVELLTVCEMAEMLGVTQESVSRILATFKRGDILHKESDPVREIYRLDASRLRQEARK